MAHAFDIYITIMLTDMNDFKESQVFLLRHVDSKIIQKSTKIVENSFSCHEKVGWQLVLESQNFYPELKMSDKEEKLDQAAARLKRWFMIN